MIRYSYVLPRHWNPTHSPQTNNIYLHKTSLWWKSRFSRVNFQENDRNITPFTKRNKNRDKNRNKKENLEQIVFLLCTGRREKQIYKVIMKKISIKPLSLLFFKFRLFNVFIWLEEIPQKLKPQRKTFQIKHNKLLLLCVRKWE